MVFIIAHNSTFGAPDRHTLWIRLKIKAVEMLLESVNSSELLYASAPVHLIVVKTEAAL